MNISLLESSLNNAFSEMIRTGSDDTFASGISAGCANVISTVQITGPVAGSDTSPSGSFSGTGTGTMSVDSSTCYGIVYSAAVSMNGNDAALASAIASGIDKMCQGAVFTINISGYTTGTFGGPSSDVGDGIFAGDPNTIETALISVFSRMKGTGSDEDFISSLCTAVQSYLTSARVTMWGRSHLSGSSGIGTIS